MTTMHSLELEQRVLENIMGIGDCNNPRVQKAFLRLTGDCFYTAVNGQLFALIKSAFSKQQCIGFVDILCAIEAGNNILHDALAWIMDNFRQFSVNTNSLESDIDKLLVFSTLRKQLYIADSMLPEVKTCRDPHDAQSILLTKIKEISNLNYNESKHGISNSELADLFYEGSMSEDLIIPTTCEQLNAALNGGVMAKSLITVAAGPGVGKTGFAIYLLDCIGRNQPNTQSLFFSLEMESKHIWMRHVGIKGGKQFDKLDADERLEALGLALALPIKLYDSASCKSAADIDFIVTTARLEAMERPLSVIVVDYLGLVESKGHFERNDLKQSDITTKLAKLALELNCVVIALSQINRAASSRSSDDRCPYPSDAADSSGSHRSSTLWLGVDRPELYNDDPCYRNQFVVKCRKNRFGGTFELIFAFNDGTFAEVEAGYFRKPYARDKNSTQQIFGSDYSSL